MAGDWIKVEHTMPDKPEVWQMAEMLKLDADSVSGKLLRVWIWADQQTTDGNATSVTKSLLDRITSVTGFADAMISVGWVQIENGRLTFMNFDKHNGDTAKNRSLSKKRVDKHRTVKRDCNGASVTKALPEKRREEKSKSHTHSQDPRLINFPIGFGTESFRVAWVRWCDWYETVHGNNIPLVKAHADINLLAGRCGSDPDKAIADIDFSISVGSKERIQDSLNDFANRQKTQGGYQPKKRKSLQELMGTDEQAAV